MSHGNINNLFYFILINILPIDCGFVCLAHYGVLAIRIHVCCFLLFVVFPRKCDALSDVC